MSWFSDAMDAVGDALNTVADAVEDGLNAAGEATSDVFETIGNGIEDGLNALGGDIPVWSHITNWLGGVISGVFGFVGAVIKGVFGIIGGVVGGIIRIIGGIFSWDGSRVLEGIGDIFSSIFGAVAVIIFKVISLINTIIPLQNNERGLTPDEVKDMKRIFGRSLAYYNIRLVIGRGFWRGSGVYAASGNREFVVGNAIYMKDHNPDTERDRLAHELVHVWQYQNNGSRYMTDAGWAQITNDDAYDWDKEIDNGKTNWSDFNGEAQGNFIGEIYRVGQLFDLAGNEIGVNGDLDGDGISEGLFYDLTEKTTNRFESPKTNRNQTAMANDAWETIRNDRSQRPSVLIDDMRT